MIILILFYLTTFLITFAFGDLFLRLFQTLGLEKKQVEEYIVVDKVFLGLFTLVFLVSILNFWLPINIYITVPVLLVSIAYIFAIVKKKAVNILGHRKDVYCGLLVLVLISFLALFVHDAGDSLYYHMQFIESIYQYPIIKGLGNLEDRYGFNSSIFLIYPLISFKFLLKFHFFGLNYFLFGIIFWYILCKIVREFSLLNVCYLFFLTVIYYIYFTDISSTTNDFTVFFCGLFLIMRFLSQKMDVCLIYVFIPCLMVTTKLSSAFFMFFSFLTILYLFKKQNLKVAWVSVVICVGFGLCWIIRNIIISGYIVYPFYNLDLIDCDWKVPRVVAMIQQKYIHDYAIYSRWLFLTALREVTFNTVQALFLIMHIFLLSIPVAFIALYKRREKDVLLVLTVLTLGLLFTFFTTPDYRFYFLYMSSIVLLLLYCCLKKIQSKPFKVIKYSFVLVSFSLLLYTFIANNYNKMEDLFIKKRTSQLFLKPLLITDRTRSYDQIESIKINNFEININTNNLARTYELFPSSSLTGYPCTSPALGYKIQALETIEMRGSSIKDGFKTTEQWKKIFRDEEKQIIEGYETEVDIRFYIR